MEITCMKTYLKILKRSMLAPGKMPSWMLLTGFAASILVFLVFSLQGGKISIRLGGRNCSSLAPVSSMDDLEIYANDSGCDPILRRLYQIKVVSSEISIPETMQGKVATWLGNDEHLIAMATNQRVVKIRNRLTEEATVYNPFRSKRPGVQVDPGRASEVVNQAIQEARPKCDFCQPENLTAEESWGRVRSRTSISAANMFRLIGPLNGIIIPDNHDPNNLSLSEVVDMFECARLWFNKVHSLQPHLEYPMLAWDTLQKSGSSQPHPHFGIWIDDEYIGHHLVHLKATEKYRDTYGGDYWTDLGNLHIELGLGLRHGSATAFSPLHSHRENEIFVVGETADMDFLKVFYATILMYRKAGFYCLSMGMSLPPLRSSLPHFPTIARIGSRGDCSSVYNDVSSLELYSFYAVNTNPAQTIALLQQTLDLLD